MKTLTITNYENYLLWFAAVHSPLDGLRLSDLAHLEALKKLFQTERFEGEKSVEISPTLFPYLRAAWEAFPLGKVARTDDLPAAVERVGNQLKE